MKKAIQFVLFSFVSIALIVGCSSEPKTTVEDIQNITVEDIQKDIAGKNTGEGLMSWEFGEDEPREISIVESKYEGDTATIIIDMKTENLPEHIGKQKMTGKLRLYYKRIEDEWNLGRVENLTFKAL